MNAIVVGAGVVGLAIARELDRLGAKVTLVERAEPGAGASNAAAGMLAPQLEATGPGPFLELCLLSRGLFPNWALELSEDSGMVVVAPESGALQIAFDEDTARALGATIAWQTKEGLRAEMLAPSQVHDIEPSVSSNLLGATYFPNERQCEPRVVVRALVIACARKGVVFRDGKARSVLIEGGRVVGVDVDGDALHADMVVLAAGSWLPQIAGAPVSELQLKPARGQLVEVQLRVPLFHAIVKAGGNYLIPRPNGTVIAGSTVEFVGFDRTVTAGGQAQILSAAIQMIPGLAKGRVLSSWAGLRPVTTDGLPVIGAGPIPGLVVATGHFRNGILLAPITANVVGQLFEGKRPTIDISSFGYERFAPKP